MYITLMIFDGFSRFFFQLSPSASTITTENIVFGGLHMVVHAFDTALL